MSRDPGRALLWVVLWPPTQELRPLFVPNLKRIARCRSKVIGGVTKFRIWVTYPGHAPFTDLFFRTQAGSVLHLCTKFEAD